MANNDKQQMERILRSTIAGPGGEILDDNDMQDDIEAERQKFEQQKAQKEV